ncbi:hypothetical protein BK007_02015 [Methanobacterium subterraneum]|uniref:Uncharacterized protein n=1 Tax=Methanobacterium subterraneum TaxID=59277 RepID=A0A2H4V9Z0_9EURY|nr:hypothetical protein [Methanobacterium subterraneum]AUB54914.1 hypothetical protein BK007_02015 [Methanobacterium subterraneum]
MKKPKFTEKIGTEAVVASFLLVFLIGCGLFFVSGSNDTDETLALSEPQPLGDPVQPANETSFVDETLGSTGYWYVVKIPGVVMTLVPNYRTTYSISELSGTVVNAADNVPSSENSDTGSLQIIQGDNGEISLVDDNGESIDWNDLPEDVKNDLKKLFPELFDDIDDEISDNNETVADNETEDQNSTFNYTEAEEEDLNISDVEYGDDDGFSDDFDDEINPDENETQDNTQDPTQNETENNTNTTIDTGNNEVGQVEEVNPLDDEEEFPEDVPGDLPDEEWINDWING